MRSKGLAGSAEGAAHQNEAKGQGVFRPHVKGLSPRRGKKEVAGFTFTCAEQRNSRRGSSGRLAYLEPDVLARNLWFGLYVFNEGGEHPLPVKAGVEGTGAVGFLYFGRWLHSLR